MDEMDSYIVHPFLLGLKEKLEELKQDVILTADELRYIALAKTTYFVIETQTEPFLECLLRRLLRQLFDTELLGYDKALELLREDLNDPSKGRRHKFLLDILEEKNLIPKEQWEEKVKRDVERQFNDRLNCGGYAFEIDYAIFNRCDDFDKTISELLNRIPFIRLLGDVPIGNDEYLVLYRWHKSGAHHFEKVYNDGIIKGKNNSEPVCQFSGWGVLKDSPEAVFAVKKNHPMYLEDIGNMPYFYINGNLGMNFEETVQQAIKNQKPSFEYHNHFYEIQINENGEAYVYSRGRVIAYVLIIDEECEVEIMEGEENYVSNVQPPIQLHIENGNLQLDGYTTCIGSTQVVSLDPVRYVDVKLDTNPFVLKDQKELSF